MCQTNKNTRLFPFSYCCHYNVWWSSPNLVAVFMVGRWGQGSGDHTLVGLGIKLAALVDVEYARVWIHGLKHVKQALRLWSTLAGRPQSTVFCCCCSFFVKWIWVWPQLGLLSIVWPSKLVSCAASLSPLCNKDNSRTYLVRLWQVSKKNCLAVQPWHIGNTQLMSDYYRFLF